MATAVHNVISSDLTKDTMPLSLSHTVQSLAHVRAMADVVKDPVTGQEVFENVIETRVTGFTIHAAILGSLLLLPALSHVPIPVISGLFLYLGGKIMKGNMYLERMFQLITKRELLPAR